MNDLMLRWTSLIRAKAREYEHTERKKGNSVSAPSLDELANEMDSFLVGVNFMTGYKRKGNAHPDWCMCPQCTLREELKTAQAMIEKLA